MNNKDQEKKCIFCSRALTNEKIPICHKCRNKGTEYGVGALSLGAAIIGLSKKKGK
ncbi:MAG: hypothetical protein MSA26_08680 [Lachnospiraceae bacterium]|nr:hypothetical protein [Lachnospiraceae bacterium]MCI7180635.1 hypothetical protein [Lachnospiraceae bacterium]